jgi:nucleoside-diphosphate-sugar epimerase
MRRGAVVIALTGASGFVGKALLRALLDAGYHVRALEHRSPLPTHPSLTTIHGSLDDAAIAGALVRDVDVVLHVGGLVLARRDADFFRVNTEATRTLATAARDAGVARFLFVSSLAAREPQLSAYAKSKYAAELLAGDLRAGRCQQPAIDAHACPRAGVAACKAPSDPLDAARR